MPRLEMRDFDCPTAELTGVWNYVSGGEVIQSGCAPSRCSSLNTDDQKLPYSNLHSGRVSGTIANTEEQEYGHVGTNRDNPNGTSCTTQSFSLNHHHPSHSSSPSYHLATHFDSDHPPHISNTAVSTLWWGDIEPWMDEEYAKQVSALMGWNPVSIKVPRPPPDPVTGQQANNPGYCYLTFPTVAQAASILAQVNSSGSQPVTMPNSNKPFMMNWASSVTPPLANPFSQVAQNPAPPQQLFPKEYSIFVGDLAPQASNSDLVAVFRNPVLGLRNDREPKFIRPFLSCKSAKIMLDPVTGVSRGYGFVRFTDEADQQRALIEMHGLYCLSRPMRISPATAKYKPLQNSQLQQLQFPPVAISTFDQHPVTIALPLPSTVAKSVSNPIAATTSTSSFSSNGNGVSSSGSGSSIGASNSSNSLTSSSYTSISSSGVVSATSEETTNFPGGVLTQIAQLGLKGDAASIKASNLGENVIPRYVLPEESWQQPTQARAMLGNLIGPNGEQITSTDPYNTTVFVGGLSPLISEETLRTFFIPFGEIHYVKVPIGKHCGFVQFVRKADAERAIEKMQGFPIGGSRIRLSWGRSQYKAAQAAAQAAQAAALQYHMPVPGSNMMTQEQALQILHKLNVQGYIDTIPSVLPDLGKDNTTMAGKYPLPASESISADGKLQRPREDRAQNYGLYPSHDLSKLESNHARSTFSPFSPDPNVVLLERDPFSRLDAVPHHSQVYAPGLFSFPSPNLKSDHFVTGPASPTTARPSSTSRFNSYLDGSGFGVAFGSGKPELVVSRPSSGQTVASESGLLECETQESDVLHDLNGTLASLELDRPWFPSQGSALGYNNEPILSFSKASDRTPSPSN